MFIDKIKRIKELLDITNQLDEDYILSLVDNSKDPVFYGYPYLLIEADKLARVTNKEKEYFIDETFNIKT